MEADAKTLQNSHNNALGRSDIALTQEVVDAIVDRVRHGKQITKRNSRCLILDYKEGQEPVPTSTYTSWLRRGTIPLSSKDNLSLQELVDGARREYRGHLQADMLKRAEQVLSEHLDMKTTEQAVHKRINRDGEVELRNGSRIIPKLVETKQRTAEFVAKKLDPQTYGDKVQTDNRHLVFSLSELRKYKQEMESKAG